jgi:hypothetical protein
MHPAYCKQRPSTMLGIVDRGVARGGEGSIR